MRQYLDLLREIKEKGTHKPAARENMPGTTSLFGIQIRMNLQEGFPLLTTKKIYWKGIVTELLWFLRGDTNIKYMVDNGANFWNEDAYNYYKRQIDSANKANLKGGKHVYMDFEDFVNKIKTETARKLKSDSYLPGYAFGDCGFQYGKVWRDWEAGTNDGLGNYYPLGKGNSGYVDQIANVIKSLKEAPESRRHIVTAIDPAHDTNLALYWCHALFQFNCRPIDINDRVKMLSSDKLNHFYDTSAYNPWDYCDEEGIPKYYLDCHLYQRSADVFLGVPFNIASYALLTHILARVCNMEVGDLIVSYGDIHIYDNHMDAVNEQLTRTPEVLPRLSIRDELDFQAPSFGFDRLLPEDFSVENYSPQPAIKAKLSTGLK